MGVNFTYYHAYIRIFDSQKNMPPSISLPASQLLSPKLRQCFHIPSRALTPQRPCVSKCHPLIDTRAEAGLRSAHIVGEVVEKLYTVRLPNRRAEAAALARQLNQWLVTLPGHFKYESGKEGVIPPPNVMELHCQYWWAVILVHRSL